MAETKDDDHPDGAGVGSLAIPGAAQKILSDAPSLEVRPRGDIAPKEAKTSRRLGGNSLKIDVRIKRTEEGDASKTDREEKVPDNRKKGLSKKAVQLMIGEGKSKMEIKSEKKEMKMREKAALMLKRRKKNRTERRKAENVKGEKHHSYRQKSSKSAAANSESLEMKLKIIDDFRLTDYDRHREKLGGLHWKNLEWYTRDSNQLPLRVKHIIGGEYDENWTFQELSSVAVLSSADRVRAGRKNDENPSSIICEIGVVDRAARRSYTFIRSISRHADRCSRDHSAARM